MHNSNLKLLVLIEFQLPDSSIAQSTKFSVVKCQNADVQDRCYKAILYKNVHGTRSRHHTKFSDLNMAYKKGGTVIICNNMDMSQIISFPHGKHCQICGKRIEGQHAQFGSQTCEPF